MMTTPNDPTTALPGRPPVVDLATWQAARDELLVREKAHTREGDALAAARRRLPMVELDGTVEVVGPDGPVPFLELYSQPRGHGSIVITPRRRRIVVVVGDRCPHLCGRSPDRRPDLGAACSDDGATTPHRQRER